MDDPRRDDADRQPEDPRDPTGRDELRGGSEPGDRQPRDGSRDSQEDPVRREFAGSESHEFIGPGALHQPASAADLRRDPPASSRCARIRGLMRDFVDSDLDGSDARLVEDHVHACRSCALALARAEHEVLRLRRAFALDSITRLRPGLGQRAVEQVLSELTPLEALDALDVTRENADRDPDGGGLASTDLPDDDLDDGDAFDLVSGLGLADVDDQPSTQVGRTVRGRGGADRDELDGITADRDEATGDRDDDGDSDDEAVNEARRIARRVLAGRSPGTLAVAGVGQRQSRRQRAGGRHRSALLTASFLAAAACVFVSWALWSGVLEMTGSSRLVPLESVDGWQQNGNRRDMLRAGQGLGEGATLLLGSAANAAVTAEWHDASMRGKQPAALMTIRGEGEMRLEDGLPLMVQGTLDVRSHRDMSVLLADGTRVELGAGEYHIDAVVVSRFDSVLAAGPDLGVRVEVSQGEPATVIQAGGGVQQVSVGQTARYQGFGTIAIDNLPRPGAGSGGGAARPLVPPEDPDLIGSVLGAAGPLAGSQVSLDYLTDQGPQRAFLTTNQVGEFELAQGSGLKGEFVVMSALPPAASWGLGMSAPDAYRLLATGSGYRLQRAVVVGGTQGLEGTVLDAVTGSAVNGARLVPCIYDEVFGLVWPWFLGSQSSDASGVFTLTRLPSSLPKHQTLGVIALRAGYSAGFLPLPLPGSEAARRFALKVRLRPCVNVTIGGLPPAQQVDIYEESLAGVAGLMSGLCVRVHRVSTSQAGSVEFEAGTGRLWLRGGTVQRPWLRSIEPTGEPNVLALGSAPGVGEEDVFRPLHPVVGTDFLLAQSSRHERFRQVRQSLADFWIFDGGNGRAPEAHLFAVSPAPAGGVNVRLIGIQSGDISQTFGFDFDPDEQEIVAVSALDGSIAYGLTNERTLTLEGTGEAVLVNNWIPREDDVVLLELQPQSAGPLGPRPAIRRFATRNEGWVISGLPPGGYVVVDGNNHTTFVEIVPFEQREIR